MIDLATLGYGPAVYVGLFLGVLLAFEGVRQLVSRRENLDEARNRRMRMINKGAAAEDVYLLLRDPSVDSARRTFNPVTYLRRRIRRAGLRIGVFPVMLGMAIIAFAAFSALGRVTSPQVAGAAGGLVGISVPIFILGRLHAKWVARLTAQLPDALDLMARGLAVGHPLSVTVENIAESMPDPIGSEFGLIQDQVRFGDDIVTAFREFGDRADFEDARYIAVAVGIQHGTGGNLSRILHTLAKVIRDRATIRTRIRAISAEGRLSAFILSVLPAGIFLTIHVSTPTFYGLVASDPLFPKLMAATVFGIVAQAVILYRLVNFRI